jgi:hypothetical protein
MNNSNIFLTWNRLMKDLSPQEKEGTSWTSLRDHIPTQGPWLVSPNIKLNPKDSSRRQAEVAGVQLTFRLSDTGTSKVPVVEAVEVEVTSSYLIRR